MKKIKITLASVGALLLPVIAFAQTTTTTGGLDVQNNAPGVSIADLPTLVGKLEGFMWVIFGAIAVISFVVAGILFLTAGGAPEKVQAARAAAIWGIAGVVVGILAYSILAIIGAALS
jgi:hypothetical protein